MNVQRPLQNMVMVSNIGIVNVERHPWLFKALSQ